VKNRPQTAEVGFENRTVESEFSVFWIFRLVRFSENRESRDL